MGGHKKPIPSFNTINSSSALVYREKMDPTRLGKSIKCILRCTDDVINAFTSGAGAEVSRSVDAYKKHFAELNDGFVSPPSPESGRRASFAKAWLEAFLTVKVFNKLQPMLGVVSERASLIATSGSISAARCSGCHVVWYGGKTAFTLLHNACILVITLRGNSNSTLHTQVARAALAAMAEASFMSAVSDAVRGIVATAAFLRSDTGVRELSSPTFDLRDASSRSDELAGLSAYTVCRYLRTLMEALHNRLIGLGRNPPAPVRIPSEVLQAFGALADSQLLAAAAAALVDSPPVDAFATLPDSERNAIRFYVGQATTAAAKSMCNLLAMQEKLAEAGGAEGRQLSAGLGRVKQHEAVRRLQVALLDQLAAHAGMAAGLEEWEGGSGSQEGRDGERRAEERGWECSSGTWWLAREEAAQGQLLGLDWHGGEGGPESGQKMRSKTAGWLERHHNNILRVTVQEWLNAGPGEAGAAGVPAAPSPLLVARLTARAAEALVRLCRGQGLHGAYAPAPEWQFASQGLVFEMVPMEAWLSVATARACAPYWLESTGWLAVLMSDATAAAMGRLPSAGRPDAPPSTLSSAVQEEGSPYDTLERVVGYLTYLADEHKDELFQELDAAAAQDDVRRRVTRCGLAACMDHTLRLTYTVQDLGYTLAKSSLTQLWGIAVPSGLAPLLPPTSGHGSGVSQAEGGGSTGCGGGGQGRAELGVVLTLSKRAAMLTRALEAEAGAGPAGAGERGQGQGGQRVVDWAFDVLSLLSGVAQSLEGDVRKRVEAAGKAAAAASGAGGGSDAAWREDAVCLDEVQEALALAERAAGNLAVALAWRLAVDVSSRRTAAREAAAEGPAVQLSVTEEMAPHTVCDVLSGAVQCWRHLLLPPAQLLACQPHRLLAAACALMDALPEYHVFNSYNHEETRDRLSLLVPGLLAFMSAHKTLSGRVRGWLAPPPAAAAAAAAAAGAGSSTCGSGSSGSEAEAAACAGCLEAPVRSLARRALRFAPTFALHAMALLKIAAGQVGGTARRTGADGGFRQFAAAMADRVWEAFKDPTSRSFEQVPMPDGSLPSHMLAWEQFAAGSLRLPVAPSGAPPPPLALPPCRQGALPRLRVCGNPHCGNFAEESEGALPLKQCGGCRAVRYCCADCQRAHWRAGHKAACKLIAAADGE